MSGPMQWSQAHGRLVPATGALPPPDDAPAFVPDFTSALEPAPRPKPSTKSKPLTGLNVLRLAKARLKEINTELRRMKALEKERGELERLIAAAEEKKPRTPSMRVVKTAG